MLFAVGLINFKIFFLKILRLRAEADLGLLQHPRWSTFICDNSQRLPVPEAINYYHKVLHLGCYSSPKSASDLNSRVEFIPFNDY